MPTLNWIAKDKVINHDKDLPFRVLKPNKKLSSGDNDGNLIIRGDNLEALKSLMPFYYNKIDCIYIDPPYNTGNDGWIYSDRLNAPQIKSWLNKVVGGEGEDLCRHDKWLCMMYPRLKLLHDLLSDKGVIFISIDDNEAANLKLVMDELFGLKNFVANFIWNHRKSSQNDIDVSLSHNYTYCYAKNRSLFKLKPLKTNEGKFSNPDSDPRGDWVADPFDAPAIRENLQYEIVNPNTNQVYLPPQGRHWRFSKEKYIQALKDNRVLFGKNGKSKPQYKRFLSEAKEKGENVFSLWTDVGTATEGTKDLMRIFGGDKKFDTPKPVSLIKRILEIATNDASTILDSFAGSGTTGQAVLELNAEDGGNRKFILVELEQNIAENVTAERLRRVINGYEGAKFATGIDASFEYLDLNGELFDSSGFINPKAEYEDLASYIFYTETNNYVDLKGIRDPFIGSAKDINYYLIFNGQGKNVLDEKVAKSLAGDEQSVIYADKCLVDDEQLGELSIVFKQIPYELRKY
ncbi:MAG TPA: site-specific DNA-methyltransferase [Candidatus Saccharimonadales bacterium]|nr:site-specific DNA-methyltransferase [Candidatus Saccharimonadales bacterium]